HVSSIRTESPARSRDLVAVQADRARGHRDQTQEGSSDRGLARSALADQRQTVRARGQPERDAVDGTHRAELDDEVLDVEQGRLDGHHGAHTCAPIFGTAATRRFVYSSWGSPSTRAVGPSSTIRPSCMTATRSQSSAITARSWLMNRT